MQSSQKNHSTGGRVLLVLPGNGFSFQEYSTILRVLEEDHIEVSTVSDSTDTIISVEGKEITPDLTIDRAKASDWDAAVFLGRSDTSDYAATSAAVALAREQWARGDIVASIGPATRILASAGALVGNRVVAAESEQHHLTSMGATIASGIALQDGNIITGRDSAVAGFFAHLISGAVQALSH